MKDKLYVVSAIYTQQEDAAAAIEMLERDGGRQPLLTPVAITYVPDGEPAR